MLNDLTLRICVVDQNGAPYDLPVDIEVRHKDLVTAPGLKRGFDSGRLIEIPALMRTPNGVYSVLVSPAQQWKPEQLFVTIPASGFATVTVKLRVLPPGVPPLLPTRNIVVAGGLQIPIQPRYTPAEWQEAIRRNPSVPRSLDRIMALARRLYPTPGAQTLATTGALRHLDECGETVFGNLVEALRSPELPANAEGRVSEFISKQGITETANRLSRSGRFLIRWFDGIEMPNWTLDEHLEYAADRLESEFEVPLFRADPGRPIEVHVRSMGRIRGQTSPGGAVDLSRSYLQTVAGSEALVRALCGHELFHRIQYSFGFRTTHPAIAPFQWFTEGTASWAEAFVSGTVLTDAKSLAFSRIPGIGFFDASYFTMPFWYYLLFKKGPRAIRDVLLAYRATGDPRAALVSVLGAELPLHEFVMRAHEDLFINRIDLPNPSGIPKPPRTTSDLLQPEPGQPASTVAATSAYAPTSIRVFAVSGTAVARISSPEPIWVGIREMEGDQSRIALVRGFEENGVFT